MLIEWFFTPFLKLFGWFISLLPTIDISIPDGVFNVLGNLLNGIGYFIPVRGLLPIFLFSISFHSFRFVWKIMLRIKSFIPTISSI